MNMLNNRERIQNKSKGPWGMKSFNFTYRKLGEEMHRHRFVNAPTQEGAIKQFYGMMDKLDLMTEVLGVEEIKD